jgi:hypothetical protein
MIGLHSEGPARSTSIHAACDPPTIVLSEWRAATGPNYPQVPCCEITIRNGTIPRLVADEAFGEFGAETCKPYHAGDGRVC